MGQDDQDRQQLATHVTVEDIAAALQVRPKTIREWIRLRKMPPAVRLSGRCVRWRASDIEAWLAGKVGQRGGAA